MSLRYTNIETQLVAYLPELEYAANSYWDEDGVEGEDCGPYIFFRDVFASYIHVLLALESSGHRDHLLFRAFSFVDLMLASEDRAVRDLAYIEVMEGSGDWWFQRTFPFWGPLLYREVEQSEPEMLDVVKSKQPIPRSLNDEIIDLYGVRLVVAKEIERPLSEIPGNTYRDGLEAKA